MSRPTAKSASAPDSTSVGLRRIRRVSTAGVAGLAVSGFAMSYGALHALARDSGVPPTLAWLWPLVVDGFILVASLSVLHAVLEARPAAYPWLLLLGFSAVSVGGNVAHGAPSSVGRLVAAVPPVALVLAFDLLMRQVQRLMTTAAASPSVLGSAPGPITAAGPAQELAGAALVPPNVTAGTAALALAVGRPTVAGQAARVVARRRSTGGQVSGSWLAAELGISTGYARRLLRGLDQPAEGSAAPRGAGIAAGAGGSR